MSVSRVVTFYGASAGAGMCTVLYAAAAAAIKTSGIPQQDDTAKTAFVVVRVGVIKVDRPFFF